VLLGTHNATIKALNPCEQPHTHLWVYAVVTPSPAQVPLTRLTDSSKHLVFRQVSAPLLLLLLLPLPLL
jgi:hypothetical protein